MYCPNCGTSRVGEVKFCTRCGTNLVAVSDLLEGKPGKPAGKDELAKMVRRYYSGRSSITTGATLFGLGLILMSLLKILGLEPILAFVFAGWLCIWGGI